MEQFFTANNYHFTAYSAALGFATLVALGVAFASWQRRATPGAVYLTLMLCSGAYWALCFMFESAGNTLPLKIGWGQLGYPGATTVTMFFFLFVAAYTQSVTWLTRRSRLLLLIIPIVAILAAFTNPLHRWLWTSIEIDPRTNIGVYGHGPVFWVYIAYSYALIVIGMLLLLRSQGLFSPLYGRQARLVLVSCMLPTFTNVMYVLGLNPLPGLELTPIVFSLTGVMLAVAIFRLRMLDIMPVARAQLIDSMHDGVLVLDHQDRIVDVNRAAQHMLGRNTQALIGCPVGAVLPGATSPSATFSTAANFDLGSGGVLTFLDPACPNDHHFIYVHVRISPLQNTRKRTIGRLFVLQDITAQRQIEHELSQANWQLQQQLTEIGALQAKLRDDALHDELTGVYNRRHLVETLKSNMQATPGNGQHAAQPLSLVMLDLDHLKGINDTYGHVAGDAMLRELADLLCQHARQCDVVCRVGGDEFVVVLPNTPAHEAYQRAEAWRVAMEHLLVEINGYTLCTTLSQGVASAYKSGVTPDALLSSADQALYAAKAGGRNRTMLWQPQPDPLLSTLQVPLPERVI